jgi:acyl-CoA thioesterase I
MPWQLRQLNCAFGALGYAVFIILIILALLETRMLDSKTIQVAIFIFFLLMGSASAQVVALGASNTEGHGVSSSESYPAQLQAMLQARGSSLRVTNAGVYGDTTSGMLARLSSAVPEGTKIVILQFGGNDFRQGNPPVARQANIASIQQQLRNRGIRIIQADGLVRSAWAAGLVQPDHIHLTAEGYRRVAAQLLPSIH